MPSETIRILPETHAKLKALAKEACEPMTETLEKAIEAYRRRRFLEELSKDFAALRADPEAWAEELKERAEWDVTLLDGLEDD